MRTATKSKAYIYLRQRLLDGTFLPGSRLSAAGLARKIGTSHIPVREALSQLQSEGLVEQKPQRGAFVRCLGRQELIDLIEFRRVIECNAAAQAARRITDAQLDELEKHLKKMRDLWNIRDVVKSGTEQKRLDWLGHLARYDMAFHMALLHAAGNQYAVKALGEANVMTRMFGRRTDVPNDWNNSSNAPDNFAVHADIFQGLQRHDPKSARSAMALHMRRAGKNILARFDWINDRDNLRTPAAKDLPDSVREELSEIEHGKKQKS